MKNFVKVGDLDVLPLRLAIERNPQLWNQFTSRTDLAERPETAHNEVSDIWLRYKPWHKIQGLQDYNQPFAEFEWYPAAHLLTMVRPMCLQLMQRLGATALGGVLITKVPPGGQVKPHADVGVWHAAYYQTKIYVPIQANEKCINVVEDEALVMRPGECIVFDNLKTHSVHNNADDDRITLIVAMRVD